MCLSDSSARKRGSTGYDHCMRLAFAQEDAVNEPDCIDRFGLIIESSLYLNKPGYTVFDHVDVDPAVSTTSMHTDVVNLTRTKLGL